MSEVRTARGRRGRFRGRSPGGPSRPTTHAPFGAAAAWS